MAFQGLPVLIGRSQGGPVLSGVPVDRTFAGRTCPIWGEAGGPRRLADVGGVPGAGFGGTAGGGSQILAVHRSCFPRFPAACGRFEPADPLVSRFGASSTRSLTFAPRSEPPRGRAPGAQTIWMRPGSSLAFRQMSRDTSKCILGEERETNRPNTLTSSYEH
eukprot:gene19834-biopygen5532